jgi:hypothetical protein
VAIKHLRPLGTFAVKRHQRVLVSWPWSGAADDGIGSSSQVKHEGQTAGVERSETQEIRAQRRHLAKKRFFRPKQLQINSGH